MQWLELRPRSNPDELVVRYAVGRGRAPETLHGDASLVDFAQPLTDPADGQVVEYAADAERWVDVYARLMATDAFWKVDLLAPGPTVIDTANDKGDGFDKCPRCGSTEIVPVGHDGTLACTYCRHRWEPVLIDAKYGLSDGHGTLTGTVIGSGMQAITADEDVVSLKCQGCGAEVVINTEETLQSRCHWCRQTLSINDKIDNGAVPDAILPFKLTKEEAVEKIREFAGKRRFYAKKEFIAEFTPDNVIGVYMPYAIVDANLSAQLSGYGEVLTRTYTGDDDEPTRYDADVYQLSRAFDLTVDDLTTETSSSRANMSADTNNVINAILPFDTKQAVAYNANYLRGHTSEKRSLDLTGLGGRLTDQFLTIARARADETISQYDRGVRWEAEAVDEKGTRILSMLLPVWLYSYYERHEGAETIHYIAVNARTGETMGSIPYRKGKAAGISAAIMVVFTILALLVGVNDSSAAEHVPAPASTSMVTTAGPSGDGPARLRMGLAPGAPSSVDRPLVDRPLVDRPLVDRPDASTASYGPTTGEAR